MKIYLKGFIGLLILSLIVVGCDKEDELPTFEKLSFDGEEVLAKLPSGLTSSSDQYAQECVGLIEDALNMSSFIDNMDVPPNAQRSAKKGSGDTWTWTWAYGGQSFTFHWTFTEDNAKRYWSMDVSFGDGIQYDYIDAWEMKDGSGGEVVYNFNWVAIYGDEPIEDYVDLYWQYTWNLDSSGNYHFTWTYDTDDPEYAYFMHYDVVVNADGSGEIDYYFFGEPYYHMEWDTAGNGSWAYYFGGIESSGTWTAS